MPRKGSHVVIIGGTKGLGRDIAAACVGLDARVTITGRDATHAKETATKLGPGVDGLACDLTDFESIAALFEKIDVVDHLVLTALDRDFNEIANFRPEDSARTALMKNVGYATAVHHSLPKFSADSSVVMFSGLSMWRPAPGSTTISMANAGVIGLVNSLATQIAPTRINAITPGIVGGTPAVDEADEVRKDIYEQLRLRTPGQRLPTPDDIISAVLLLLDNPGINGANLTVDAGLHLV